MPAAAVSRNAPVSVTRRGLIIAWRDLPVTSFLYNVWGLAILKKLNTQMRVYRSKIYIHMKFMKRAFDAFIKFHMKWQLVYNLFIK